jgi:hypothetical protein
MPVTTLTARARAVWVSLAHVPVAFTPAVRVAVSPRSALCPPGWAGVVVIAGAAIATAPDRRTAQAVQRALSAVDVASVTEPEVLCAELEIADLLGPAALGYLDTSDFRPWDDRAVVDLVDVRALALGRFMSEVEAGDLGESGIQEITSPAFVVREHDLIVAAAGYRDWPGQVAHLSVLTATRARGRGLARATASAAVSHALAGCCRIAGGVWRGFHPCS